MISMDSMAYYTQRDLSVSFLDEYTEQRGKSMLGLIFGEKEATQGTEPMVEGSDIGAIPRYTGGQIDSGDITQGRKVEVTPLQWAYMVVLQYLFVKTNLYNVTEEVGRMLGRSFYDTREAFGASVFNNGNNTTVLNTADTLSLFNDTHTEASGSGGSNQDNLGTASCSAANVIAQMKLGRKMLSQSGAKYPVRYDTIIHGVDLDDTVYEIIASHGKPDVSTNNRNFLQGKYDSISWDWFSSSTAYVLAERALMKRQLLWWEWAPVSFFKHSTSDTLALKMIGHMAMNIGCANWRWGYASAY